MTTAIDEIARLTARVQELEAELKEADEDATRWENDALTLAAELEEAKWQAGRSRTMAEFIEDVRRGIRDLTEFEAVCA